jgi:hypothetical protein
MRNSMRACRWFYWSSSQQFEGGLFFFRAQEEQASARSVSYVRSPFFNRNGCLRIYITINQSINR